MQMKRIETETIINYNMAEDKAHIVTSIKSDQTKIEKLGFKTIDIHPDYKNYDIPKEFIKIGPKRKVSDKQRKLASERMKSINDTKYGQPKAKKPSKNT
jgi:predicted RNA-binding protein associated with RNAse of E/G family